MEMTMSITILGHHNDPPLVFKDASGDEISIQTGTIVFEFFGGSEDDWLRTRLTQPVFQIPAGTSSALIQSIASAGPSSFSYFPTVTTVRATGLVAEGRVLLKGGGSSDGAGGAVVVVEGDVRLPVIGLDTAGVSIPRGGWAIDHTTTTHSNTQIELVIDMAILGPTSIFRIAYTLFVKIRNFGSETTTQEGNVKHIIP
jgi:hypothetical protein